MSKKLRSQLVKDTYEDHYEVNYNYRRLVMAGTRLRPGDEKWWGDGDTAAPITPWGRVQHMTKIGKGLAWVMTSSHGGLAVSAGMARKLLSRGALKFGILLGGYYWFEEDVAWAIPYYEMDEWRVLDNKFTRGDSGRSLSKELVDKTVKQWYKKYYAENNRDERVDAPPKKGDLVVFNKEIEFNNRTITKGTVGVVSKVTPSNVIVRVGGMGYRLSKSEFDAGVISKKGSLNKTAVGHPNIPIKLRGGEKFLAFNESSWQWEDDSRSLFAAVILDTGTGKLRMELVAKHTKSGLGAGSQVGTKAKADMGTLSKPKVGGIASILSQHGHDRTRAGYPFSRSWTNYETGKEGPLKAILLSYLETMGSLLSDKELREQLKQNLDKLPMDVVRKLLSRAKGT